MLQCIGRWRLRRARRMLAQLEKRVLRQAIATINIIDPDWLGRARQYRYGILREARAHVQKLEERYGKGMT